MGKLSIRQRENWKAKRWPVSVIGGVLASHGQLKHRSPSPIVLSEEINLMLSSVIQNTFLQPKSEPEPSMVVPYILRGQHTGFISE